MFLQDVAHGRIRDVIADVGECSLNAVTTAGAKNTERC